MQSPTAGRTWSFEGRNSLQYTQDVIDFARDNDGVRAETNHELVTPELVKQWTFHTEYEMRPYIKGLLDRGISVLTSRALLASGRLPLDQDYGPLQGL